MYMKCESGVLSPIAKTRYPCHNLDFSRFPLHSRRHGFRTAAVGSICRLPFALSEAPNTPQYITISTLASDIRVRTTLGQPRPRGRHHQLAAGFVTSTHIVFVPARSSAMISAAWASTLRASLASAAEGGAILSCVVPLPSLSLSLG